MSLENIKYESMLVDKKQIIVVRFDFEYPMVERDLQQVTQALSNVVNEDKRFLNRVIFLPKGFDLDSLDEQDFIQIWKSKSDKDFVDEITNEEDPNQLKLFQEVIENE